MVTLSPPLGPFGTSAPDFLLPDAVSGESISLADVRGNEGAVVMFICNHCPFVRAVIDRIVRDMRELEPLGVKAVAIMSNDVSVYPEDDPAAMKAFAARHKFPFPYLYDESQAVARAYGAVCTPDFFGYDRALRLRYRGRLDASRMEPAPAGAKRELFEAMRAIAAGKETGEQIPSLGCSIKWRG
ncbi:thioredoxin family protein [Oleispirillum naphthae]|uniref:thioredoxin family protein n=1 Tax=Oleispirillum naphthae TaxID=2838853 RepID=UPI00308247CC